MSANQVPSIKREPLYTRHVYTGRCPSPAQRPLPSPCWSFYEKDPSRRLHLAQFADHRGGYPQTPPTALNPRPLPTSEVSFTNSSESQPSARRAQSAARLAHNDADALSPTSLQ